jgi:hypothetical protein
MKLGGLCLVAMLVGCGGGFSTVPAGHWQKLPVAKREAVDASTREALVSAAAEVKAASTALAAARRDLLAATAPATAPATATATAQPADADADTAQDPARARAQAERRAAARAEIERATVAQLRAKVAWREQRLVAAEAHLDVVLARREFDRALAIDRSLPSDQTYEVALYRGQYASAQERWYITETRSTEASRVVTQGGRDVAAAKEAFALTVREDRDSMVTPRTQLQLSSWNQKSDLRRRGFKVIATSDKPCRRGKCFRQALTTYLVIAKR